MSVFFLADTHFGDGNILRYENRPFATVEEMDRELIRRWNEKMGAGDTVFHLGDFSARGEEEDRAILKGRERAAALSAPEAPEFRALCETLISWSSRLIQEYAE